LNNGKAALVMIVVDYKVDKSSLMIWHEATGNNPKEKGGADGESTDEFDTNLEEQSSKSTIHDKSILANDSSSVRSAISHAKHYDKLQLQWKATTDKGNNTGIVSFCKSRLGGGIPRVEHLGGARAKSRNPGIPSVS
jgi:hypothetical protein